MSGGDDPVDDAPTLGSEGAPTDPGPPSEADRKDTRRTPLIIGAVVVLLVLLIGVLGFTLTRGDDASPARATTTTERETTTTRKEPLPVGTVEIATTKSTVPVLKVQSTEPPEWASAETTVVPAAVATIPPASQDSMPEREALPIAKKPIQGRRAIEGGWEFDNPGPYLPPQPFTMLVTERRGDWVKVLLPLRPNHTEGFVKLSDVDITTTTKRIEVNLTTNTLTAYDGNTVVAETPVVAGSPFTQTPTGRFYITDIVPQKNPAGAYGPFALATNGYSEMIDEFDTGVPVVALHGTNAPDKLGTDVSNGCIRLPNDVVTQLAETFPLGAPVYIWP